MATRKPVRARRDRWADWAVIGVLAVALLLGLAVMVYAEGQTVAYTSAEEGLTVRYSQGWILVSDPVLLLQVRDPDSGRFKTTYQIRAWPVATTAPMTSTLASALNDASLARAQEGTAYRMFDIVEGEELDGQPTMESTYVYVVESTDLFSQKMPVVVMGLDVAVAAGDKAYVFSLLAAEDSFEAAESEFRRFVEKAEIVR